MELYIQSRSLKFAYVRLLFIDRMKTVRGLVSEFVGRVGIRDLAFSIVSMSV